MTDTRRRRSQWARKIAWILTVSVVVAFGLVRWSGGPSPAASSIRRMAMVEPLAPSSQTASAYVAEHRPSSTAAPAAIPSPSAVPPVAGGAPTRPPVFDLATLAQHAAPEPSPERDRF